MHATTFAAMTLLATTTLLVAAPAQSPRASRDRAAVRPADHPLPPTVAAATTAPDPLAGAGFRPEPDDLPPTLDGGLGRAAVRAGPAGGGVPVAALPDRVLFDATSPDELWAVGHDWKACFDGGGTTFVPFFGSDAPCNFPLRFELLACSVGGEALSPQRGKPTVQNGVVVTDRGSLVETVATSLDRLEQSFTFRTLPNRGAVLVDVAITTTLRVDSSEHGLTFHNEHGRVRYEKAIAIDAAGASLPLAIGWDGDSVQIEIPAWFVAAARLPLVLDPVIDSELSLAPGQATGQLQRVPDVATLQSPDRALVVWQWRWSLTDHDCRATLLDGGLGGVGATPLIIDTTAQNWLGPRVAGNRNSRQFLVVAQIDVGSSPWIGGRLVSDTGTMGTTLDIERAGVVGLAGANYSPVVGGDPHPGTQAYFLVVWEHATSAANHDIYYKLVRQNGQLLTTNPSVLANTAENETNPAVGKSNDQDEWRVAWQRTWNAPPYDEDVRAAHIEWGGQITVPQYPVANSTADEVDPSCSSPADPLGNGARIGLVTFTQISGGQGDIRCRAHWASGQFASLDLNLNATEVGGAFQGRSQFSSQVDSDGTRFVVAYTELDGTDYDTYAATLALIAGPGTWRIDDERVALGATSQSELHPRLAAYHSGGGSLSERYIVTSANWTTNDISAWLYGGHAPGPFFTTRPTQCGSLAITASGAPVVGGTLNISVASITLDGMVFGFPGSAPLAGVLTACNCTLGVSNGFLLGNPLVWTIPNNVTFVGTTLSAQGFAAGSNCMSLLRLSNTLDFTIR